MCRDSATDWLLAMHPALTQNRSLATSIAEWASGLKKDAAVSIDGPGTPALRRLVLARQGFEATGEAWVHLWKPLSPADAFVVNGVEVAAAVNHSPPFGVPFSLHRGEEISTIP